MNKIKQLINKAYSNGWFNMFCVALATICGLTQMWVSIVFAGLYMGGFIVYDNNKISLEDLQEQVIALEAQLNKKK
jgi:hypothetical protein